MCYHAVMPKGLRRWNLGSRDAFIPKFVFKTIRFREKQRFLGWWGLCGGAGGGPGGAWAGVRRWGVGAGRAVGGRLFFGGPWIRLDTQYLESCWVVSIVG